MDAWPPETHLLPLTWGERPIPLHAPTRSTKEATAPLRNSWLLYASLLLALPQSARSQTAKDGEQIVEYFKPMAEGIGIEMVAYSNGQQRAFLPTLNFPRAVWDLMSIEEQTAVAIYVAAESARKNTDFPRRKAAVYRPGVALRPWYISLGALTKGAPNDRFVLSDGKEFYFDIAPAERPSVFSAPRLGDLSEKLRSREPPIERERERPGKAELLPDGEREELQKLLQKGLVVREPSTVFTAILSQNPEYSNPESPEFGWESPKGPPLGTFRTGYLMEGTRYKWRDTILVRLPVVVGEKKAAHVRPNDVTAFGTAPELPAQGNGQPLQRYRLTPNTQLLSPFDDQEILLSNSKGSIQAMYRIGFNGAYGEYSIAKTAAGYFLGYAHERGVMDQARLTWEQACRERNWRFQIKKQRTVSLQAGGHVFRLASFGQSQRAAITATELGQATLKPVHFELLLGNGLARVHAELKAPTDSGFEEPPVETGGDQPIRTGYARYVESAPESIEIYFLDWDEHSTTLEISERKQERTVETWFNGSTIVKTSLSPWKRVALKRTEVVENDLDGCSRFTDGQFIYEIGRFNFKAGMTKYTVEENSLYRNR